MWRSADQTSQKSTTPRPWWIEARLRLVTVGVSPPAPRLLSPALSPPPLRSPLPPLPSLSPVSPPYHSPIPSLPPPPLQYCSLRPLFCGALQLAPFPASCVECVAPLVGAWLARCRLESSQHDIEGAIGPDGHKARGPGCRPARGCARGSRVRSSGARFALPAPVCVSAYYPPAFV